MARPIPLAAPVIMAAWPDNLTLLSFGTRVYRRDGPAVDPFLVAYFLKIAFSQSLGSSGDNSCGTIGADSLM